jgi:uncharacterized membrane protein YhaH (DUF805 family)
MKQNPQLPMFTYQGNLSPRNYLAFFAMAVVSALAIVAIPTSILTLIFGAIPASKTLTMILVILSLFPIAAWLLPAAIRRLRDAGTLGSIASLTAWGLATTSIALTAVDTQAHLSPLELFLITAAPNAVLLSGIFCLPAEPDASKKRRNLGLAAMGILTLLSATRILEIMTTG